MCLKDLKERFARIDIHASAPLVAFRESAFLPAELPDAVPKSPKVIWKLLKKELIRSWKCFQKFPKVQAQ